MTFDKYGEVTNSQDTYDYIAEVLNMGQSVFIGWTDEEGSHLDILFSPHARVMASENLRTVQGGIRPLSDLFVSIMRMGAFGFDINNTWTSPGYYGEKLMPSGIGSSTADKLAELINGVKYRLYKLLNK